MPQAEFSLKERDRARYVKDRVARALVTSGGLTVLLALILIFFYLVSIVLPIFSDASIQKISQSEYSLSEPVLAMGLDDYGENFYVLDKSGELSYLALEADKPGTNAESSVLLSTQVIKQPTSFASGSQAERWFGYGNANGQVVAIRPAFSASFTDAGRFLTPNMEAFLYGQLLILDDAGGEISELALAVSSEQAVFVGMTKQGKTVARVFESEPDANGNIVSHSLLVPQLPDSVSKLLLSPDGRQLFALSGSELFVAVKIASGFTVRDVIDLSGGDKEKQVRDINLLAGAQSLLVTHKDNSVSQWFDVLENGSRRLKHIRNLNPGSELVSLIPYPHNKGFLTIHNSGLLESHHTTSENRVLSEKVFDAVPEIAAISLNEHFLLSLNGSELSLYRIDNLHPDISFNSLWRKVWYENYPEPQYVWQSTAASDAYEAKFSFIPITFGTIKAALFCMLISMPVAILGAVYTAYFMSSSMRKVVKPTIELMEALPTVIIGFLAGMWLAPIVEMNLSAVVALFILVPLVVTVIGALWSLIPAHIMKKMPNGWHAMMLIPVLIFLVSGTISYSPEIENLLFSGDIQGFLSRYGIGYDQRNALVVGIAMGFAVIPTIFTIAEDAIFSVPKHLSDGSLALGATQWQTLTRVVLFTASPGIFSAVMVGLGRAVGETMIVLMATGNTPVLDWNILEGMRTLSATIAVEMPESEVGSSHYRLLFLSALILFIFTFAVNSLAEVIRQRLRDKYSSM